MPSALFLAAAVAADGSPDPAAIKQWLEVVAWLAGIAVAVAGAWKLFSGTPHRSEIVGQPLEIKAAPGVASADEMKQVHGRIARERQEIEAQIARVEQVTERRLDKLEGKIDDNTKLTAEMSGTLGHMNQTMHALSTSVTNFIQREASKR